MVDMKGGGTLLIERIDSPGERHSVIVNKNSLVRGNSMTSQGCAGFSRRAAPTWHAWMAESSSSTCMRRPSRKKAIVGRLLRFD